MIKHIRAEMQGRKVNKELWRNKRATPKWVTKNCDNRYDVCDSNSLRDMTINSFFVTFDLHLWPSAYVKVTFTLISRCTLCICTSVPSMKFIGSIEFKIWTIVCWKLKWRHNDVITHSNLIKFKHKTTKGISKRQTEFHFDWT